MKSILVLSLMMLQFYAHAEPLMDFHMKADVVRFSEKAVVVRQNGKLSELPREYVKNSPLITGKNIDLIIDKKALSKMGLGTPTKK